jgi:hypothetical protein
MFRPAASLRTNTLWLAAGAALLVVAFLKATPYPTSDSAYFEFIGRQMVHGAQLYRDVWDNKLPSISLTNAVWQMILGEQYRLHTAARHERTLLSECPRLASHHRRPGRSLGGGRRLPR